METGSSFFSSSFGTSSTFGSSSLGASSFFSSSFGASSGLGSSSLGASSFFSSSFGSSIGFDSSSLGASSTLGSSFFSSSLGASLETGSSFLSLSIFLSRLNNPYDHFYGSLTHYNLRRENFCKLYYIKSALISPKPNAASKATLGLPHFLDRVHTLLTNRVLCRVKN